MNSEILFIVCVDLLVCESFKNAEEYQLDKN